MAAQIAQFSGTVPAHSAEMGGSTSRNSVSGAAVSEQNSGAADAVHGLSVSGAAVTTRNSGTFSATGPEIAANRPGNSGNFAGNSGRAAPPETDLNYRNNGSGRRKTAAGPQHDPNQLHWHHAIPGGRAAEKEDFGSAGSGIEERRLTDLISRAVEILGDQNRASLAVAWLEEDQKRRIREGLRPRSDELERWLGWALDRADAAGTETAAPDAPHPGPLPRDVVHAVQDAARQAVKEMLPALLQEIRDQFRAGGTVSDTAAA